ncbi:caltractin-like [Tyto alba]|uniref:caltractin-like n=1 Tax=Tyto alba TaxID=56313 RepID=UPI001C67E4DD|nr:caltractin-like [Tyto alba]
MFKEISLQKKRVTVLLLQASSSEGRAAEGSSVAEKPAPPSPLTEEQRRELRGAFELFDPDGCGLIDVGDLEIMVRAQGCELRKDQMKRVVSEFSGVGSGKLTFKLFLQRRWYAEPCLEKEILEALQVFGWDATGKIFEKLKVVASEVGGDITDEELQEMIDEADVDGDGDVDKQEFLRILALTDP